MAASNKFDFENKIVLVTGAAGGVGREVVDLLVSRGATVVATDITETVHELATTYGAKVHAVVGDVSVASDVEKIFDFAERTAGPVDILIANAGALTGAPLHETDESDWDALFASNVKSFFLTAKRAVPSMLKQRSGTIVATGSMSSVLGLPSQAAYCATKGAVLQLARQIAVEYAAEGIRCNAVGPGAINTPMLTKYLDSLPDPVAGTAAVKEAHPMQRWAHPSEIAQVIAFLASDSSSFVTGQIYMADGGYSAR